MKYKELNVSIDMSREELHGSFKGKNLMILAILQDLGNEKFWRLIKNRVRGKNKKIKKMSLEVDGEFITDPKQMETFGQIILKC